MKKIFFMAMFFFAGIAHSQTTIDKVIAVVGKNMIKLSELESSYLQATKGQGIVEEEFDTKCTIIEGLLLNKLLLNKAETDSLTVTDEEINHDMEERIVENLNQMGGKENLERAFGKSLDEIREYYRPIFKDNLLIQKANVKITENVMITPKEVTDYFATIPLDSIPMMPEEFEFQQIVIFPTITAAEKQAVKDKLNEYRDRILKGTSSFQSVARLYSDDKASAKQGGDLGYFGRGTMVSEFENIAFSLKDGEISPVFESKYGYHIIQLIDRKGDQINCRHILLQIKVSDDELMAAEMKLDSITTLIKNGKITFSDAVKQFSQDESKNNDGNVVHPVNLTMRFSLEGVNYFLQNDGETDFTKYNEGDIVPAMLCKVDNADAVRILKIKKKITAHQLNVSDDYDKIYQTVLQQEKMKTLVEWANTAIKQTYIKLDDAYKHCNFRINWTNN